jgi:hypothetical protein
MSFHQAVATLAPNAFAVMNPVWKIENKFYNYLSSSQTRISNMKKKGKEKNKERTGCIYGP